MSMLGDTSALRAIWLKGSNCDDLSEVLALHSLSDDLSVYADSIENLYLVLGLPEGVLDTTSLLLHCEPQKWRIPVNQLYPYIAE
ncbi:MAG: hypothetical protein IPP37_07380 [Saprospiraceae bacterium]|nr:hypothetical protein [Saprospiraceae bacterium]